MYLRLLTMNGSKNLYTIICSCVVDCNNNVILVVIVIMILVFGNVIKYRLQAIRL